MVDGRDSAWRNRAPGPHAHRNTARQAMDGLWTEVRGQQKQSNDPGSNQHILNTPTMGAANVEMTPARAPAAAADRKQRPDATCEGKNG